MTKFWYRFVIYSFLISIITLTIMCNPKSHLSSEIKAPPVDMTEIKLEEVIKPQTEDSVSFVIDVIKNIRIKDYFFFIDSLVARYDTLVSYVLTEHQLVNANPWIIDSFVATDYYSRMDSGEFIYDQNELIILHAGAQLLVPDSAWAKQQLSRQRNTIIDINIPEYRLRILENGQEIYSFSVRVGQDRERFLLTANRVENLRTRVGKGSIYKTTRDPVYMNPVDGHQYESTLRDDGRRTRLPQIPFLHPIINGHRWGQLIHPTTNRKTLGRAYSNGCIGTGEGDAWRIYYNAPVGTEIIIRYDLEVVNELGDTIQLKDIYNKSKKTKRPT